MSYGCCSTWMWCRGAAGSLSSSSAWAWSAWASSAWAGAGAGVSWARALGAAPETSTKAATAAKLFME